jgi:hypothetical protein
MDQDPMVNRQFESGKRLMELLSQEGFEVRAGMWAKPTDG